MEELSDTELDMVVGGLVPTGPGVRQPQTGVTALEYGVIVPTSHGVRQPQTDVTALEY